MTEQGPGRIPLWRLVAMGAATLPVLALHSQLADLEQGVTQRLRQMQRRHLAGMGLGCAVIYLGFATLTLHPLVLLVIGRAWLAWYGLALLAGVVAGWRLAWTLPATVAVILWYWGYQGDGHYYWWEFSVRPYDDIPSLLLSVSLLGIGLTAYSVTPWRRRRWLRTSPAKSSRRR